MDFTISELLNNIQIRSQPKYLTELATEFQSKYAINRYKLRDLKLIC